ncbi:hypothetical protein JQX13_14390 [Archangium violaceum]|uniref:hypothetical protein n=1 Tax=Archangium violaceum TaxID=83451 RepID=UPI00193B4B66|nr:hypothetical protein [Archangium violaceum]QRK11151.1 hypothetical protein JQX13_14390 [Archangium violaceum]
MSYSIDLSDELFALMEELPRHTSVTIHLMLARIAELAALWPPDDERWKQFTYQDDLGLRFYVQGCCVRLYLDPEARRVVVCGIGRVLVTLPDELLDSETGAEGSPAPP